MKKLFDLFLKKDVCTLLVNRDGKHVDRYNRFKDFLGYNQASLGLLAELEQMHFSGRPFTSARVREKARELLAAAEELLRTFRGLSGDKFNELEAVFERIQWQVEKAIAPIPVSLTTDFILNLDEIDRKNLGRVGAKAGNLGLIKRELDLPVPDGFALTADGGRYFLKENGLEAPLAELLSRLNPEESAYLDDVCRKIQELIRKAPVPPALEEAILKAYRSLEGRTGEPGVLISLRSSAIGEDTEASFAGQFLTVLNVRRENLLEAYKTVLASKYSPRAVWYRWQRGLEDADMPMAMAALVMVRPKASGVLYSVDVSAADPDRLEVSAIWGLGEELVGGQTVPDSFAIDRRSRTVVSRTISRKERRLMGLPEGGTHIEEVPETLKEQPTLDDETLLRLADYGIRLEAFFGTPQDVEWAQDTEGRLFVLQSRPLHRPKSPAVSLSPEGSSSLPVLFYGGQTASPGWAAGPAWVLKREDDLSGIPDSVILVAPTASPKYARLAGRIKGLVTEMGSVTSHLASVAREFAIPFVVGAAGACTKIPHEKPITLEADSATVYNGIDSDQPVTGVAVRPFLESPVSRRLRDLLDLVSPLNLTDPQAPVFSPEGCRTIHDLVRFTHEWAMKLMFGLGGTPDKETVSVRMKAGIPLIINLIDLGGGLRTGLTDCDAIVPDHIESVPMKALWKGFNHPGITWKGTVQFDPKSFLSLMASSATSEFGDVPGGESFAFLSRDYLNLSARFGYHFANLDVLCGEQGSQNYASLQFSGGAGNYLGRSLRILFLEMVLKQLGFEVSVQGDLLEAALSGYDQKPLEEKLDQLGRLLASTRLLDMALKRPEDVERLVRQFSEGDYDFLAREQRDRLPGFYIQEGDWELQKGEDGPIYLQDGSRAGFQISTGMAKILGKVTGPRLQDLLDRVEAYYYFPLALAKDSEMREGTIRVEVKVIGGHIDRAGGIAFGLRSLGNYFVWRLNALEDNLVLFEYAHHKRTSRGQCAMKIESDRWYDLRVDVTDGTIRGFLDGVLLLTYKTETPLTGYAGLWTKADSITLFRNMRLERK
jgi:pyruvate,water dikinase